MTSLSHYKSYSEKISKKIFYQLPILFQTKFEKFFSRSEFIQNINFNFQNKSQKRVLISYITTPFKKSLRSNLHPNEIKCLYIVKSFIDLGYCIDIIDSLNETNLCNIENVRYDVIFGFGKPFYLATMKNQDAKSIIFLTESHPDFSLKNELERLDYFFKRKRKNAPIMRSGIYFKKDHIGVAKYAILTGNQITANSYSSYYGKLFSVDNFGLINSRYANKERAVEKTRKNFVWFGSYGAIHKGLDVLIDAFDELKDYNLFICGLTEKERRFFKINNVNIHDLGFIDVNSDEFIQLMENCSFIVFPSCAEGMSTSVLTCMNHGLIPIISRNCGIDVGDYGFYLEDYHVESIKKDIISAASLDINKIRVLHQTVFTETRQKYDINKTIERFNYFILKILNE
jgi:glycosyltransferase involved in cell wall biosynthesis